jgi:hypothetical protein
MISDFLPERFMSGRIMVFEAKDGTPTSVSASENERYDRSVFTGFRSTA